jgi:enoyl-CoA hydratase
MIERSHSGTVAVVRLSSPPVNALDTTLLREITEEFAKLAGDDVSAVVLSGAGRAFSAGVDLRSFLAGGEDYTEEFLPVLSEALSTVFSLPKPVVAAVNGHAIAGGAVLAFAADARLMVDDSGARIGTPELVVGVPFPRVPLEITSHAVGPRVAHRLVFGADTLPPAEALALGLVDELVAADGLIERAVEVANRLATAFPPDTFATTKAQLRRETVERIDRYRVDEDPRVLEIWNRRATDGWTARYLEQATRKR